MDRVSTEKLSFPPTSISISKRRQEQQKLLRNVHAALKPTPPHTQWVPWALSAWVRRPTREPDK